jgi:meiosis-specific protein HOP1
MPEMHACYKCLLQEKEGPLLTELEHLTLLRKGASVAMKGGIHGDRQFAEALRMVIIYCTIFLGIADPMLRL